MATLLTHDDRHSPGVVKIRKHLEAELESLRRYNDKSRSEPETEFTRGEIARVKALLAHCEEPKKEKTAND